MLAEFYMMADKEGDDDNDVGENDDEPVVEEVEYDDNEEFVSSKDMFDEM